MPTEAPYDDLYSAWTSALSGATAIALSLGLFAAIAVPFTAFDPFPVSLPAYARAMTIPVWAALIVACSVASGVAAAVWFPMRVPSSLRSHVESPWTTLFLTAFLCLLMYAGVGLLRILVVIVGLLAVLVLTLVGPLVFLAGLSERDGGMIGFSLLALVYWLGAAQVATARGETITDPQAYTLLGAFTIVCLTALMGPLFGEISGEESAENVDVSARVSDGRSSAGLLSVLAGAVGSLLSSSDSAAGSTSKSASDAAGRDDRSGDDGPLGVDRLSLPDRPDPSAGGSCQALTTDGEPCSRDAEAGERTCWQHDEGDVPAAAEPVEFYKGRLVGVEGGVYALGPTPAADERAVDAFESAVRQWRGIGKNEHVAAVRATGDEPRPWVVFDAGWGRLPDRRSELGAEVRFDVLMDVVEAVRTADMYNVTHGGIEPGVVFLDADDADRPTATVAGWGLERGVRQAIDEPSVTPYTAPEQLDGETAGIRTDVYRLGALAYYLLSGSEPFADADDLRAAIEAGDLTPSDERGGVADPVADVIETATAADPADRFESPAALRRALLAARERVDA